MVKLSDNRGFTLVELAVVMVIIGLLIGGVLKGQELISNAQSKNVMSQIRGYETAWVSFRDMYNALPGDMRNAQQRLPNCTGAIGCVNGGGTGVVGTNGNNTNMLLNTSGATTEETQVWKHLALTDLISGVETSYSGTASWGQSHPSTALGGGLQVVFARGSGATAGGHFLRMQSDPTNPGAVPVVSPRIAYTIDQKMDDGRPNSGIVRAHSLVGSNCGTFGGNVNIEYESGINERSCLMAFRISN